MDVPIELKLSLVENTRTELEAAIAASLQACAATNELYPADCPFYYGGVFGEQITWKSVSPISIEFTETRAGAVDFTVTYDIAWKVRTFGGGTSSDSGKLTSEGFILFDDPITVEWY